MPAPLAPPGFAAPVPTILATEEFLTGMSSVMAPTLIAPGHGR
jgi:hypothetical protein